MKEVPRPRVPSRPGVAVAAGLACGVVLLAAAAAHPGASAAQEPAAPAVAAGPHNLYFDPCPPFAVEYAFTCYHTYAEVQAFLEEAARRHPRYARLHSIGKSYQGRDLWVLTITDPSTGPAEDKPAVWVDGGIDADEVVAIEAALGVVHRLLTSDDPRVAELRRTRTFHVAPKINPDASELHLTTPIWKRDVTLRPWDDDGDGLLDEDPPDDLDGDGQALRMRAEDPTGGWVQDERDPRLMRRRRAGDEGPFYHVYPEGLDDDGDGEYNEDPPGGVDPNRNYPGNWSPEQGGGGPFAGSEAEIRAVMDFALAHPNIAASQHFHSSGGVLLRPPSVPDLSLPSPDEELYLDLSRHGLEVTGYHLATSVYDWNWPRGSGNRKRGQVWRDSEGEIRGWPDPSGGDFYGPEARPRGVVFPDTSAYPAYGGSIDAMYLLFGVVAFANEIYSMGEDLDGDGRIDEHEQLVYSDRHMGGAAFKEWTPFEHPQLGPVEIGGWRKFGRNNPLPERLPEEVRRNVDFVLMQAAHTQLLSLASVDVEDLGDGVHRVTATVRNAGYAPTELAIAEERGHAVPVRAELAAGEGVEVLTGKARQGLGVLAGHSEEEVEWVVRGPPGAEVTVRAWHRKAGRVSETVRLR